MLLARPGASLTRHYQGDLESDLDSESDRSKVRVALATHRPVLAIQCLGDSPTSHSRWYQLPMLMSFRQQAAPGGQNVIGGPWAL